MSENNGWLHTYVIVTPIICNVNYYVYQNEVQHLFIAHRTSVSSHKQDDLCRKNINSMKWNIFEGSIIMLTC